MATVSKDEYVHIYLVRNYGLELKLRIRLENMNPGRLVWSPDSSLLACCSGEELSQTEYQDQLVILRIYEKTVTDPTNNKKTKKLSHELVQVLTYNPNNNSNSSNSNSNNNHNCYHGIYNFCSFSPNNNHFITGGLGGRLEYYSIKNKEPLAHWFGVRVRGLHWLHEDQIIVADNQNRIQEYHFKKSIVEKCVKSNRSMSDGIANSGPIFLFREEADILSLRCYKHQFNDRWICALGVKGRGVRLWDLESKSMVRNFCGVQQKNNVYLGWGV